MENTLLNRSQENKPGVLADIKSLFKAIVLISNVLPIITGFWLALYFTGESFQDNWGLFSLTIAGSTLIMAGALLLNNWYDADIDAVMKRTKQRPTVTGTIPLKLVLVMGVVLSILGFAGLLLVSVEASIYGLAGWFIYVVLYTIWSKRKYAFNTLIGSLSGAVTPLIGWAAVDSASHVVPIVLSAILFIWQVPHTFAISIKRYDEYRAAGVAMLPVVRGVKTTKRQMLLYIICLFPLPFLLSSLGWGFLLVTVLLTAGWIILAVKGFTVQNEKNGPGICFYTP
ncbi:heme o synthase [Halobacillus sp. Marseille-Q1614]|uniref:heme o synthase n=1 Tax=Halobacillus sp. Marseille-Q1614 TaxID=2709134 RepID=UPI0035301A40